MHILHIITQILSIIFMLAGLLFCSVGVLGMFKMPDLLSKQHAFGVIDSLGCMCIILSLVLSQSFSLISVNLIFLGVVSIFLSAPITNALVKAAIANNAIKRGNNKKNG